MPELPSHIEFEYVWVTLESGPTVVEVRPFQCVGYDPTDDSFIWQEMVEDFVHCTSEENALAFIKLNGILRETFQAKLN